MILQRTFSPLVWLFVAGGLSLQVPASAQQLPLSEPAALLQRIADAAKGLTYTGTFVHTHQDNTTTSRISHLFEKGEEWERIESIDGPRQETIRRNDEMYCFQPESKTVKIDRRMTGKFFPSLINGSPDLVLANYRLKLGKVERIGGHDCQWIILEPRDALRFLQKLCADVQTGLLLRAKTVNDRGQIVEQFSFTQLIVGKPALKDPALAQIKTRFFQKEPGWQTDDSGSKGVKMGDTGWVATTPPTGFKLVNELKRNLPGRSGQVAQLVYSDGIAAISVFIEPIGGRSGGFSRAAEEGMVSYAMRAVDNHQVTAVGEVPVATAQGLANSVTSRQR